MTIPRHASEEASKKKSGASESDEEGRRGEGEALPWWKQGVRKVQALLFSKKKERRTFRRPDERKDRRTEGPADRGPESMPDLGPATACVDCRIF